MKRFNLLSIITIIITSFIFSSCSNNEDPETFLFPIDRLDQKLNVYMCVDMEGMSGVVHVKDCNEGRSEERRVGKEC